MRRRAYLLRLLGLYALAILFYAIPGLLYASDVPAGLALGALVGIVAVLYLTMVQVALRLHDLDLRAWWWLVMLLPGVSYVLGAGLQLVQGTVGPNRFGPDPKRPYLLPPLLVQDPEAESASET
ncbi:DUF805 domain-containing protein [Hymenobacter sp. 5317J-9]|nr:DUF805 domain-containing protein [Hymenobacter sp. 5317J-9]